MSPTKAHHRGCNECGAPGGFEHADVCVYANLAPAQVLAIALGDVEFTLVKDADGNYRVVLGGPA